MSVLRPQVLSALVEIASEGELELPVSGTSMAPLLAPGDRVRLRREARYRAGDLLAFRNGSGELVLHRLLGRRRFRGERFLVLRGDAAPRADGLVRESDVLGRVVGGDVASAASNVPFRDRLRARLRYLAYWIGRLRR